MKKFLLILSIVSLANAAIFFVSGGLPTQFGNGADGTIVVNSGTVNIDDIYENDSVTGVTTKRGADKGLNYGAGTYDPENGAYINAVNFTVESGATLTHGSAYGTGASNKNGIGWIACIVNFDNQGTILLTALGLDGGVAVTGGTPGFDGNDGSGSGNGNKGTDVADGAGGSTYGSSSIPTTTWANLYGSGGGSGGATGTFSGTSGAGGSGGGALRIFATSFDTSSGTISCDGANGGNASGSGSSFVIGGGGAGSGGTVYIETVAGAILGTDKITASSGTGGTVLGTPAPSGGGGAGHTNSGSSGSSGTGGNGSVGRIHIEGSYTGSTSDPAII